FGDGGVRGARKTIRSRTDRQQLFSMLTAWGGRPFGGQWLPGEEPIVVGEFPQETDASQLHASDVLPHLEGRVTAERNYLYCATFQLAWDELRQQLGTAPQMEDTSTIAAPLNHTTFPRAALSPESYVARMGFVGKGIRETITAEMARK